MRDDDGFRKVLDFGFNDSLTTYAREDLDYVVQAARVSYGDGTKTSRETEDLFDISLNTLTTPFKWSISNFISKCRSHARQHSTQNCQYK